jgi:AraC-like DNA-binding protein
MKIRLLKNYFVEIWLLIVAAIAVTIIVLSIFLYKSFELSTIDTINRLNQDSLRETRLINEYVRKMIRTSGMELFSEPSIRRLMYERDLTNFEVLTGIRRIDSVQSMGRFIHSIYIYNAATGYVYTTSNQTANSLDKFEDRGIVALLTSEDTTQRLIPIARYASANNRVIPVHTFVFFSTSSFGPDPRSALVINVTLDWLSEIVFQGESKLYVVDSTGTVIFNTGRDRFLHNFSREPFVNRVLAAEAANGTFIEPVDGKKSLVFYSSDLELKFIRVFDYSTVMAGIRRMQSVTLASVVIVMAFGVLVAFFLSRLLYRPIRKIVRSVTSLGPDTAPDDKGDLGRISTVIESMAARASSLEEAARSQLTVLRKEVLKELLKGNLLGSAGISELFLEYGIHFRADQPFRMAAARLNPAVKNLAEELPLPAGDDQTGFPGYAVAVDDVMVFLLQGNAAAYERRFIRRLQESGARVVAYSQEIVDAEGLSETFARMNDVLKYAFLYEPGQAVPASERRYHAARFEYPSEIEKQILQLARSGDKPGAADEFQNFFQHVSAYRYEYFHFSIRRLYVSLQVLAREIPRGESASEETNSRKFFESVTEGEVLPADPDTIQDITLPFERLFDAIAGAVAEARSARHREISDAVLSVIREKYPNPNLSLQSISDGLGFSVSYISKIFKESYSASVADSINNYRIEIAKQLLLDETATVREIARRVGFSNDNYFYTLFHKKVGVTPAVFRRDGLQNPALRQNPVI